MRIMMLGDTVAFCRENEEIKELWIDKTNPNKECILFFYYPGFNQDCKDFVSYLKETYPYIDSVGFYNLSDKPKVLKNKKADSIYCDKQAS